MNPVNRPVRRGEGVWAVSVWTTRADMEAGKPPLGRLTGYPRKEGAMMKAMRALTGVDGPVLPRGEAVELEHEHPLRPRTWRIVRAAP